MTMFTAFIALLPLLNFESASARHHVWPPPKHIDVAGTPLYVSPSFSFVLGDGIGVLEEDSTRLQASIQKYSQVVGKLVKANVPGSIENRASLLKSLELRITRPHDAAAFEHYPSLETDYSYTLSISGDGKTAFADAQSQYGLIYAMETFSQLLDMSSGCLIGSDIYVADQAQYNWRGIMIDSGRRFVPVPTLENIIDTAAAVKLNVLHLHASDMCRFGVESKKYPNLTESLTGIHAGHYSQDDIKHLVEYAANAGMRIVPEFDVPGHSRGFRPLMGNGLEFCRGDSDSVNQLYNDPGGKTYNLIKDVLQEMSALFPDEVFNIGCDETNIVDSCTLNSTFDFERKLFREIDGSFQKTPAGWEEAAFDAGAATRNTIVDAWSRHSAADVIANGWRAIESKASAFYMTQAVPGGPSGWKSQWYDISTGIPVANSSALLGGEISMWTDTYCYEDQCGAFGPGHPVPVGAALFPPTRDAEFSHSIAGMMWPRGYVGAASFWSYNASEDPTSGSFVDSIWSLNDKLNARGSLVCPTNCTCDQLTSCGKPYIKSEH